MFSWAERARSKRFPKEIVFTQIIVGNPFFYDIEGMFSEKSITAEDIVIEDNAWLGAGAIITDGVREGKDFVAAAAAVVMRDVPLQVIGSVLVGRVVNHPLAVRTGIFLIE